MPRVNKRTLLTVIAVLGAVAVFQTVRVPLASPGLIPPVAVFFYLIRPRLKMIAQAEGTYRPTRRDQALDEIQAAREERQREKEREAAIKRTIKRRLQRDAEAADDAETDNGQAAAAETETAGHTAGAVDDARATGRRPAKRRGGRR